MAGRVIDEGFPLWPGSLGRLYPPRHRGIPDGAGRDIRRPGESTPCLDTAHLLFLAVATSIDALAVGISFAFLGTGILLPCLVIGLTTFGISFLGALLGGVAAARWGKTMEILGGVVLIGVGIRILVMHMAG